MNLHDVVVEAPKSLWETNLSEILRNYPAPPTFTTREMAAGGPFRNGDTITLEDVRIQRDRMLGYTEVRDNPVIAAYVKQRIRQFVYDLEYNGFRREEQVFRCTINEYYALRNDPDWPNASFIGPDGGMMIYGIRVVPERW